MSPSSKFKLGCTQFEDVDKSTIESGNAGLGVGGFVGTLGQTSIHDQPYLRFYSYPAAPLGISCIYGVLDTDSCKTMMNKRPGILGQK